ncbi:MAG: 16S rRNA (uracil(1498)-N(3))-methyltransferase [candidate division Zixibacteria bacterium]|nr:16S rRNA (uracil(1498)-N(3))-methyltransferase [candidate division Zixibacteria bacterium]
MADVYGTVRMIPTFIYDPATAGDGFIVLDGAEAHHLASVLRMKAGETIRVIDGSGTAFLCEIVEIGRKQVRCRIIETQKASGEPRLKLTLVIGLSTSLKFDMVIEKGTEVGVSRIVPLVTSKGRIKRVDSESGQRKASRWRRIAEAAAKQSGRSVIPSIESPQGVEAFIAACRPEESVLFHPDGLGRWSDSLDKLPGNHLTILVGPESGFSPEEVALAEKRNIPVVGMGDRVLRTETAGIVLSALAIYSYETVNDRS